MFLLDSGIVGETAPMIQIFMEKMKQDGFRVCLKINLLDIQTLVLRIS